MRVVLQNPEYAAAALEMVYVVEGAEIRSEFNEHPPLRFRAGDAAEAYRLAGRSEWAELRRLSIPPFIFSV